MKCGQKRFYEMLMLGFGIGLRNDWVRVHRHLGRLFLSRFSTRNSKMVLGGNLDKWRKHPILTVQNRDIFPGLRNAVVIFGVYCVCDFVYKKATAPGLRIDPASLKWEKEELGAKPTLSEE